MKLTPMELMERLVALVPRPRVHLTRFHGVLAPHYKHRKKIVPKPLEIKVTGQESEIIDPNILEQKKKNIPWARGKPRQQHHFEDDFNQQHFDLNFDNFNQFAD